MKYRKKPVVIQAVQLTAATIKQAYEFMHGPQEIGRGMDLEKWDEYCDIVAAKGMNVTTLEDGPDGRAKHVATLGDWIIKGVHGEFYPCKPDIFAATYDAVHQYKQETRQEAHRREAWRVVPVINSGKSG